MLILLVLYLIFVTEAFAHKIIICHVPPGNPENMQTLEVDESSLKGHLDNNGKLHKYDYWGPCKNSTIHIHCAGMCNTGIFHPGVCDGCDEIIVSGSYIGTDKKEHYFGVPTVNSPIILKSREFPVPLNSYNELYDKLVPPNVSVPVTGSTVREKRSHIFISEIEINLTSDYSNARYFFDFCTRHDMNEPVYQHLLSVDIHTREKTNNGHGKIGGPYFQNNALMYYLTPLTICNNAFPILTEMDALPVTAGNINDITNINIGFDNCQFRMHLFESIMDEENHNLPAKRLRQLDTATFDFNVKIQDI